MLGRLNEVFKLWKADERENLSEDLFLLKHGVQPLLYTYEWAIL